ncbi:uncharacterized protein LOC127047073 isoform X1 [Gopherus flavomarginatus]|uniref:uncharacterized protein LOC127047073 isoform X1 n=1 Tax=Gopherus flavomarginatus TaxID=286002 RepID=UPI0021CC1A9B|nr:uncharacterized protein LOC127047073 isoform X1 [Gopherus flavomarginatus]
MGWGGEEWMLWGTTKDTGSRATEPASPHLSRGERVTLTAKKPEGSKAVGRSLQKKMEEKRGEKRKAAELDDNRKKMGIPASIRMPSSCVHWASCSCNWMMEGLVGAAGQSCDCATQRGACETWGVQFCLISVLSVAGFVSRGAQGCVLAMGVVSTLVAYV